MRATWGWTILAIGLFAGCDRQPLPTSPGSYESALSLLRRPGTVTDLVVVETTDTSATLSFTEVSDGSRSAANYDIRYAKNVLSWGSATSATQGTCTSPLAGTTAGARRTCTVAGLERGSRYEFQMVAFRGTLRVNAFFGGLSNVTGATITAPVPVDSVTLTPSTLVDSLGRTIQFQASAIDASGNVIPGRTISWSSSDAAILTIDSTGLARGVGEGTAVVTASSDGKTANAHARIAAPRPATVNDLSVVSTTDNSMTVRFTEVSGGTGGPASYDIRVLPGAMSWGSATSVSSGTCALPVTGTAVGTVRTCTILGLLPSTLYSVQLVSFRGLLNGGATFGNLSNSVTATTAAVAASGPECASPRAEWIWCDDFEQDRLARYFEYDPAGGRFVRAPQVGHNGSQGMRVRWDLGTVVAGSLHLAIGQTPLAYFRPVDAGTAKYRDIYWRIYVKNQPGWIGGGGDKLSRAFVFANSSWAQAAIGHVWSGVSAGPYGNNLVLDPARGTDAAGTLLTTKYNDFTYLTWLGQGRSTATFFDASNVGQWHCIESRMRLNQPGLSDGLMELWVNGTLQAQKTGLNFLGSYTQYGINAVYFENYWNAGSAAAQERYFDNIVVSTARIGCMN